MQIVVAIDGSSGSKTALRWALHEAELRSASVKAVLAWTYLEQRHPDGSSDFQAGYTEDDARAALDAAVSEVTSGAGVPAVEVAQEVVLDLPARAIVESAERADLLVVGARGLGGFQGLLLGSVSERVLETAPCPVVVIHEADDLRSDGPVVVGIDGSKVGVQALHWAAEAARARGSAIRVVHAWQVPGLGGLSLQGSVLGSAELAAEQVVQDAREDPSLVGLDVDARHVMGSPAQALFDAAEGASLVVVGTRGHGRFARAFLGSTSRQVVRHATCPVAVVPPAI